MTRSLFVLVLIAAAGGAARADGTRVHTSATVEVLDDKAQIDDVITRLRAQQALDKRHDGAAAAQAASLKVERPAPPTSTSDSSHRAVGPEPKDQRPGSRRVHREHGTAGTTERPRIRRR